MSVNKITLLYSDADGEMERIADVDVDRNRMTITAYSGHNASQLSSLLPKMVNGIPFWRDPDNYKHALVKRYGIEGMSFDKGIVVVRWGHVNIKSKDPDNYSKITILPDQERPKDRSNRL